MKKSLFTRAAITTLLLVLISLVSLSTTAQEEELAKSQVFDKIPVNLNGAWKANDGGTYYISHIRGVIWWTGMSEDGGKSFTNVLHGKHLGDRVQGEWADVPLGGASSSGRLMLKIVSKNQLKVLSQTGGFGGTTWTRVKKQ